MSEDLWSQGMDYWKKPKKGKRQDFVVPVAAAFSTIKKGYGPAKEKVKQVVGQIGRGYGNVARGALRLGSFIKGKYQAYQTKRKFKKKGLELY